MTEQERINVNVQRQIDQQTARIDRIDVKLDAFIEEMREFKKEVKESRAEMATIGRHVRNITIAAMVGIGALAVSGGAIAVAVVYSVLNH